MIGKKRGKKGTYPVYVYDKAKGKKVYVGARETHREAKDLERAEELRRGKITGPSVTIKEFAAQWTTDPRFLRKRPEASTREHNRSIIGLFCKEYGDRPLSGINRGEALSIAESRPHWARVAAAMYNDAINSELYEGSNPFARLGVAKSEGRSQIDPLTEEEVFALADCARAEFGHYGNEFAAFLIFQGFVGTRPGEAFALTWADIDLEGMEVNVGRQRRKDGIAPTKNKLKRRIVLPLQARDALLTMESRRHNGFVFLTPKGRPFNKGNQGYFWRPTRAAWLNGLPSHHWLPRRLELDPTNHLALYEMRHACGSMLADAGCTAREIASHLGNTPEVCERVYVHLYEDRVRDRIRAAFSKPEGVVDLEERRDRRTG